MGCLIAHNSTNPANISSSDTKINPLPSKLSKINTAKATDPIALCVLHVARWNELRRRGWTLVEAKLCVDPPTPSGKHRHRPSF